MTLVKPVVLVAGTGSSYMRDFLNVYRHRRDISENPNYNLLTERYDFDAWYLHDDYNAVTEHAASEMKLQYSSELGLDRSPKEMLKLANDMSWSLAHYLKNVPDKDQDSIDMIRAVIPWLRFWGRAGHGFVAEH